MNIYIDIETLRSDEQHKAQLLEEVKANFKAPSNLTKTQAAKDLGLDPKSEEVKFTAAADLVKQWETELAEEKSSGVAHAKWEKTSFNPDVAPIACICMLVDGRKYKFHIDDMTNEEEMLQEFHITVDSLTSRHGTQVTKPMFVGHNLAKFDLPFIWKRSVIHGVTPCKGVKWVDARHGVNCFDTMTAWAGFGHTISADNLCKVLRIKGKTEGMDGSKVYDAWQENHQKVISYCMDDVEMVQEIHGRLTNA